MSEELVYRLKTRAQYSVAPAILDEAAATIEAQAAHIAELEDFASWVDTWVSNPVGAYSVYALNGLFGQAREKIAALSTTPAQEPKQHDSILHAVASLAAAISLLKSGGRNAAPSDRMFDQMIADYEKTLEDARVALSTTPAQGGDDGQR